MKWAPAVRFEECYLSVYSSKEKYVYLSKEIFLLLNSPKRIMVSLIGKTIVFSPARKYGVKVLFNINGQPFIVHKEANEAISSLGNRAYYLYDEEDYDYSDQYGKYPRQKRRYFYFRVNNNVPVMPATRPKTPAKR